MIDITDHLIAPETLSGYARQAVRIAQRRGVTMALVDASSAYAEALSAQGELLAREPDTGKYALLDEGYNAIRAEQRRLWSSQGRDAHGVPSASRVIYGVPTTHLDDADDVIRRVDAERFLASFWPALDPADKRTFTLLADDHTWEEAAAALGITKSAMASRVKRGKESIRRILDGEPAIKVRKSRARAGEGMSLMTA